MKSLHLTRAQLLDAVRYLKRPMPELGKSLERRVRLVLGLRDEEAIPRNGSRYVNSIAVLMSEQEWGDSLVELARQCLMEEGEKVSPPACRLLEVWRTAEDYIESEPEHDHE